MIVTRGIQILCAVLIRNVNLWDVCKDNLFWNRKRSSGSFDEERTALHESILWFEKQQQVQQPYTLGDIHVHGSLPHVNRVLRDLTTELSLHFEHMTTKVLFHTHLSHFNELQLVKWSLSPTLYNASTPTTTPHTLFFPSCHYLLHATKLTLNNAHSTYHFIYSFCNRVLGFAYTHVITKKHPQNHD